MIIVAISLGATQADGYGSPEACWLDVPSGLIWAFIAPAIVIILVSGSSFALNFVIRERECFITFPNTEKRVQNTLHEL